MLFIGYQTHDLANQVLAPLCGLHYLTTSSKLLSKDLLIA